jgi:hypothetical protein
MREFFRQHGQPQTEVDRFHQKLNQNEKQKKQMFHLEAIKVCFVNNKHDKHNNLKIFQKKIAIFIKLWLYSMCIHLILGMVDILLPDLWRRA